MTNLCEYINLKNPCFSHYTIGNVYAKIGEIIGISRCSVYRGRIRALDIIRENYMEE